MKKREILGENIKKRMEGMGMTPLELAAAVGTGELTVIRWLTGERCPSALFFYRIAKVLGTTMDGLMQAVELGE